MADNTTAGGTGQGDATSPDRTLVDAILDGAFVCQVACVLDGHPVLAPMNYGRAGDRLYLHGRPGSRLMQHFRDGGEVVVSVTVLDAVVLTAASCSHAVHYRSVLVRGRGFAVDDDATKIAGLRAIGEQVVASRWDAVPLPDAAQLAEVEVVGVRLTDATVRVRPKQPLDMAAAGEPGTDEDAGLWCGVIPLSTAQGPAVPFAYSPASAPVPALRCTRG
jgi:uncharacterized protein